jgi:hypothetical protein
MHRLRCWDLTVSAKNLMHNKPLIIRSIIYCEVNALTLTCPLSIKLSPVRFAGWCMVYSRWRLGSLACVPEVWIFQIQRVGRTCASAFHTKLYCHIVALPDTNTNMITWSQSCNYNLSFYLEQEIWMQSYKLFMPAKTCLCYPALHAKPSQTSAFFNLTCSDFNGSR